MAAGIVWNTATPPVEHEVCDESTIYRLNDGGMDLDMGNLPSKGWLPELAPLFRDKEERKAYACIRVKVVEKAETTGAEIKIKKNIFCELVKPGMYFSDGTNVITVKSVDTSNEGYDLITATENLKTAIEAGTVLPEAKSSSEAEAKHVANFASLGWRKLDDERTVAFVGRVFGILEDDLYIPFTDEDKKALGDRFMFI